MARPALLRLLAEVEAGRVQVIVVYKVDRLTRSLADFAKIVEILDRSKASFVSVTQAFNTTTSMGRLTLNVLLSFAQFEREVTGERIRDKIAASKRKGMWMGGPVPLGYDVRDRKLVINEAEAATVRHMFERYLVHGSLVDTAEALASDGVVGKRRIMTSGKVVGGQPLDRGGLAHLLRNPLYIGKVRHRSLVYDGEHPAIVPAELWDAVQAKLDANLAAPSVHDAHKASQPARRHRVRRARPEADPEPCGRAGAAVPLLHHPPRSGDRRPAAVAAAGTRSRAGRRVRTGQLARPGRCGTRPASRPTSMRTTMLRSGDHHAGSRPACAMAILPNGAMPSARWSRGSRSVMQRWRSRCAGRHWSMASIRSPKRRRRSSPPRRGSGGVMTSGWSSVGQTRAPTAIRG